MSGLLAGKVIVIAGISDDQGFGWACAKACAEQGARIIAASWVPLWRSFEQAYLSGQYQASQQLSSGKSLEFEAIWPLDGCFDHPDQVPETVRLHKRYAGVERYTIREFCDRCRQEVGEVGGFVHAMANAPEIRRPLLATTREGYLAALSASSYSWISLLRSMAPLMQKGSGAVTLSYEAAQRVVPGYGGGMSSAKAALESDVRTLAYEVGRHYGVRVNAISAGPLASRAARAIGPIKSMIAHAQQRSPLSRAMEGGDVGDAALFLLSPWARAITGTLLYVDNGLHAMGPVDLEEAGGAALALSRSSEEDSRKTCLLNLP